MARMFRLELVTGRGGHDGSCWCSMDCCTANNASGTYSLPGQQTSTRKRKASHVMLSAQDELRVSSRVSWLYCAVVLHKCRMLAMCAHAAEMRVGARRGLVATSEGGWELKEVCEGHKAKAVFSHDLLVTSASCTCCKSKQSVPGTVPCKHVAALLYSAVEPPLPPAASGAAADNPSANVCFIVLWDADMTDCRVKAGGVVHDALETVEAAFMAADALAASRGTAFTYSALSFSATAPVQLVQRPTYVQNSPLSDFLTELYNTVSPPEGQSPRKAKAAAAAAAPRTSSSDMVQAITAGCDKARVDWSGMQYMRSCTMSSSFSAALRELAAQCFC
eukprot:11425-Heterococcus_DN1.PRE.2